MAMGMEMGMEMDEVRKEEMRKMGLMGFGLVWLDIDKGKQNQTAQHS